MKKLLLALCVMFSLGFAAQPANAVFGVDYQDGDGYFNTFAEAYGLGYGVATVHYCWSIYNCYWPDIYTIHGNTSGFPATASLGGAPAGMAYRLLYYDEDYYYFYYNVYVTNNYGNSWTYLGTYAVPY